jgi:CheY-like chemotaxis protein
MNLIINASEATGDRSGVVTISTGVMEADRAYLGATFIVEDLPEGYYCYFEVADTGCGMGADTMEKIFDPFFTTKFAGRGLGLAAVLGIVRGHKGALKVYSQLDRGTTFKVLLPCAQELVGASGEKKQKRDSWRGQGTVLVADDEEHVVTVTKQLLEKRGLRVLVARDGKQAVTIFEQRARDIDVVVLDLTMPHMSGEEAFREIRRIDPDVRVILTSGYSEEDTMSRFAGKGVVDFIQKPYRPGSLIAAVRSALESKPEETRPRRGPKT